MNDDDLRWLLEIGLPLEPPPADLRDRVHAGALRAWEQLPSRPARWRAKAWFAVAAVVAAVGVVGWLAWLPGSAEAPAIAEIEHATGGYTIETADSDTATQRLTAGASVRTSGDGRLLIRLDAATVLRLDMGSAVTLAAKRHLRLHRGRLFVDSTGAGVTLETDAGVRISDVGTQFEARVDDDRVAVGVREGSVEVVLGSESVSAAARDGMGEVVVLEGGRVVSRRSVATTDPHWYWIHGSMPAFRLDAATVYDFLAWATREAGLELAFVTETARRRASSVTLHGPAMPAAGLARAAIREVLETVPSLQVAASTDHRFVVELVARPRGEGRRDGARDSRSEDRPKLSGESDP